MSHHSGYHFYVFDRRDASARSMFETAAIADLLEIPTDKTDVSAEYAKLRKSIGGMTRSDYFKMVNGTLLDEIGHLESLRFLSEQTFTHRQFYLHDKPDAEECIDPKAYGYEFQYTIFPFECYQAVIDDINRLINWCANHVDEACLASDGYDESSLLSGLYLPIDENETHFSDDGYDAFWMLLTVLRRLKKLFEYAKTNNLCAVYVNEQYCTLEWYRKDPTAVKDSGWYDNAPMLSPDHIGFNGKFYAFSGYTPPKLSTLPIALLPQAGLPVDIKIVMSASTASGREKAKINQPSWSKSDKKLEFLFTNENRLLTEGKVVWAALVQANPLLLKPIFRYGAPAELVYDPLGRMSKECLAEHANKLFAMKGRKYPNELFYEKMAFYAEHLENEATIVFGLDAPFDYSTYPLKVSSTYIDQLHLPDGMLTLPYFPILISDTCPGAAKLLPCQFWPAQFRKEWYEKSEGKHGRVILANHLKKEEEQLAILIDLDGDVSEQVGVTPLELYETGLVYFHGRGVPQDYQRAIQLWVKAASMGHDLSNNNLGVMYADGEGVPQDLEMAYELYKRAATKNLAIAQVNLGKMHLAYDGIDPDIDKAKYWLDKAATQGNEEAQELLIEFGLVKPKSYAGKLLKKIWGKS